MAKFYRAFKWTEKCVNEMHEEEWKKARQHGPHGELDYAIGGSDCGTVLGVNEYKSDLELYYEKKGIHAMSNSNPDIFKRGHLFEETIARCLEEDLREEFGNENVYVYFDKYMYGCGELLEEFATAHDVLDFTDYYMKYGFKNYEEFYYYCRDNGIPLDLSKILKYPYMVLNYDCYIRICVDGKWKLFLGEIKTTGAYNYDVHRNWKENLVPTTYDSQVRYYEKGFNVDGCFIMCAWGLDKTDRAYTFIRRDEVLEEQMMSICDEFINGLWNDSPPEENAKASVVNDYYSRLYSTPLPLALAPEFEIPESYRGTVDKLVKADELYVKYDEKLKIAEDMREEAIKELFPLFKESRRGRFELDADNTLYISSKPSMHRDSFNEEALKAEHPEIYAKYAEKVDKFDKEAFKKAEGGLYSKYVVHGEPKGSRTWDARHYNKSTHMTTRRVKTSHSEAFVKEPGLKL